MGDVHIPQEDPNTSQRIGAKVESLIADGHQLYASAVTGTPTGRVRRPTLFVLAGLGTLLATFPDFDILGAVVGLIAIVLLAISDNVVEL